MDYRQILARTIELLTQGWTTGALARNSDGYYCSSLDRDAVCWCLHGALIKATIELDVPHSMRRSIVAMLISKLSIDREYPYTNLALYNDTQESVEPILRILQELMDVSATHEG